jgi:predicted PurR-regulated permease PerM
LQWLNQRKVPNGLAILMIIAAIVVGGMAIGAVVGASISSFRGDLPEYQERLQILSAGFLQWLSAKGLVLDPNIIRDSFNPSAALSFAGNTLASFGNVMTNAFMIILTVIFILAEEVRFTEKLKHSAGGSQKSIGAIANFTRSVNQYMAIKTGLSLLTGVIVVLWLMFLGVDYPILWGLLAFLLNFVPTLGSIIAAVPAVLLALVQLGPGDAVLVGLGYLAVNTIVGNGLEPRMMGRGLNLSALVVFLSLVFWGWVLGPIGMLLSVPLTMTVKIALESSPETRWISVMLGSGNEAPAAPNLSEEQLAETSVSLSKLEGADADTKEPSA